MSTDQPFRWSFSQWEAYNSCPARWKYQSVLKLPRKPPGKAAARGLLIHATIEDYICNRVEIAHAEINDKYYEVFDAFRDHPNGERHTEYRLGLTKNWTVTAGFKDPNAWCSMVFDAARVGDGRRGPRTPGDEPVIAYIGEWKSGSPKDTHGDQRKLYALGAAIRWPHVDEVQVTTYYVEDKGAPQRLKMPNTESARDKLKTLWLGRVDMMQRDAICAPKPGMHCSWCDFAKKQGGPCVFGA